MPRSSVPPDTELAGNGIIAGLHDRPGHLVRRLQQIAVAAFLRRSQRFAITPVQYAVLISVRERPGLDQASLAALIAFDRSTLGVVVERLERNGLLRRLRHPQDRRRYVLEVTAEGGSLLRRMRAPVLRSQEDLLGPLSDDERAIFIRLLRKLVDGNNELSRSPVVLPEREGA